MTDGRYIGTELELFARAERWKRYWAGHVGRFLGDNVLDVGAGLGETARNLAGPGQRRWVCVEPDRTMADRIAARIRAGEIPSHCEVLTGTIDDVGESDFSAVVYIDVLEHIEHDREEVAKAGRHLAPGGRVIVLAPAHQWLFSPFDQAIGHWRRYTLGMLKELTPPDLIVERALYLDSVGLFASLANKLIMKASMPTEGQIRFWNDTLVPASRIVDPILGHRLGKTAVVIWRKAGAAATP